MRYTLNNLQFYLSIILQKAEKKPNMAFSTEIAYFRGYFKGYFFVEMREKGLLWEAELWHWTRSHLIFSVAEMLMLY